MIISMPLFIDLERKTKPTKRYYINLNNYRNWHYQVNNKLKAKYKYIVRPALYGVKFKYIALNFILHRGDRRRVDRANILSIHEKFLCDAIVECGCIKDDNDNFLHSSHYYTGAIDKENPRVDIEVIDFNDYIPLSIAVPVTIR
tara:strand:- start:115 stop:546 length:432 start_codon:yes stop_codon:yes gene_type:complete